MNDDQDNGIKILTDMLTRASEFPGENEPTPSTLYKWHFMLRELHQILMQNPENAEKYIHEYVIFEKKMLASNAFQDFATGLDILFEWMSIIAQGFEEAFMLYNVSTYNVSGPATTVLRDVLVKISTAQPPQNPRTLYFFATWLKSAHAISSPFHDLEYITAYEKISLDLNKAVKKYPSDEYVYETANIMFEWLRAIVQLYQTHGILVPEILHLADTAKGNDKKGTVVGI